MINIKMQPQDTKKLSPKITVIGVGGAGGNAVNNMISSNLEGVDFVVCNTDSQALESNLCGEKLQIGTTVTGGLGAGARPEVGRAAAEESLDDIMHRVDGANMAFITAGMGGGTGTGAAPVIAQHCREQGLLTVGVVTKPFHFEGTHRMKQAEAGISEMQKYVDTLIVIPNQNLFRVANDKTTFADAFKMADGVLQSGVRGITDLMVMPGLINLDFADIRSAMQEMGKAMMGTGESEGDKRATEAAEAAISNPLLDDVTMKGAKGLIINITGGNDMTLFEVDEACNRIRDEVDTNANIIFGSTFDEKLEGRIRVSIVATGIDAQSARKAPPVTTSTSTGSGVPGKIINERTKEQAETTSETKADDSSQEAPSLFDSSASSEPTTSQAEQEPIITNSGALRGSVQEGNFIPPAPMQVSGDAEQSQEETQNYVPSAPQATRPEQSQSSRRKAPGFFERLTGGMRQEQSQQMSEPAYTPTQAPQSQPHTQQPAMPAEGFPETAPAAPNYTQRPMTGAGGQGLAQQPEYQGQLQSQTQDSADDEELDIPAFLRRQAS